MPLLSVIIPNYNNQGYLPECLDSILGQTFHDYEIIVADDCSRDGSPEIIRQYEKKYPALIKGRFSQINRGVSQNRHEAIVTATGKYLTTIDSDDYYFDKKKLEKEISLIQLHEKKGKQVIAFSNVIYVTKKKKKLKVRGTSETIKEGNIFTDILTRTCEIPLNFIFPSTAYQKIGGFDQSIPLYEDWDLKVRLSAQYEYYYTGCIGTAVRLHGAGLSSSPIPELLKWMNHVFDKNISLADPHDRQELRNMFDISQTSLQHRYINAFFSRQFGFALLRGKNTEYDHRLINYTYKLLMDADESFTSIKVSDAAPNDALLRLLIEEVRKRDNEFNRFSTTKIYRSTMILTRLIERLTSIFQHGKTI